MIYNKQIRQWRTAYSKQCILMDTQSIKKVGWVLFSDWIICSTYTAGWLVSLKTCSAAWWQLQHSCKHLIPNTLWKTNHSKKKKSSVPLHNSVLLCLQERNSQCCISFLKLARYDLPSYGSNTVAECSDIIIIPILKCKPEYTQEGNMGQSDKHSCSIEFQSWNRYIILCPVK